MRKNWVLLEKQQGGVLKLPEKTFVGLKRVVLKFFHGSEVKGKQHQKRQRHQMQLVLYHLVLLSA
jgi:hypothetical protein